MAEEQLSILGIQEIYVASAAVFWGGVAVCRCGSSGSLKIKTESRRGTDFEGTGDQKLLSSGQVEFDECHTLFCASDIEENWKYVRTPP
jgi:hypothetical protein